MEFMLTIINYRGVAAHIPNIYFFVADAAVSILRGSKRVQRVISKIPVGRIPGEMLDTEIWSSNSYVRV